MAPGQCVQSSVHVKFVTNSEPEPGCEHWARSPIQQKCRRGEERRGEERRGEERRGGGAKTVFNDITVVCLSC